MSKTQEVISKHILKNIDSLMEKCTSCCFAEECESDSPRDFSRFCSNLIVAAILDDDSFEWPTQIQSESEPEPTDEVDYRSSTEPSDDFRIRMRLFYRLRPKRPEGWVISRYEEIIDSQAAELKRLKRWPDYFAWEREMEKHQSQIKRLKEGRDCDTESGGILCIELETENARLKENNTHLAMLMQDIRNASDAQQQQSLIDLRAENAELKNSMKELKEMLERE